MKKAIIVLVSMLLVTLISVASLSAAFVYPGGYVRYYPSWLKDKTTTNLIFNAQPDEAGAYDYTIYATVMGISPKNNAVPLKTTVESGYGKLYYTTSRRYDKSATAYDGAYGLGLVYVYSTHGNFADYWYAY